MFKGHPKGLIVAFFTNMGERFGFYTMMAILVLFLQAKFGLTEGHAGIIYSIFYFSIYFLAVFGGYLADRVIGLNNTISIGIVTMTVGYVVLAVPGLSLTVSCIGLFIIALGNGLFKGNLQALVGNLYEDSKFSSLRDRGFSLFYMGINIGAIFAPTIAKDIRDWYIGTKGFLYDAQLPKLAHDVINGSVPSTDFLAKASAANTNGVAITADNALSFAHDYINSFSTGYNYAFGIAAVAMVISLIIYSVFKKDLRPGMNLGKKDASGKDVTVKDDMPKSVVRQRLTALGLVFMVVIFFWMSFHQNGLTLTFYARDYVQLSGIDRFTYLLFDIWGLIPAALAVGALFYALGKNKATLNRVFGIAVACAFGYLALTRFMSYDASNKITAEIFQGFNPMLVVILTPIVVGFFGFLNQKGKEPSTPRKIGIGMLLAALAFTIMAIFSVGQELPAGLNGAANTDLSSPYLLIGTYFTLTVAELFLSPMGISFVSKVAPPKYKGLAQGGWLCATAVGNLLLSIGSTMWGIFTQVWQVWAIFVVCCLISASVMFLMMKRIEQAASAK
ncbi:MAG: peptide MFS transporter [Bacteroidales bacterium]